MTDNMCYDVTGISGHENLTIPALNQSGSHPKTNFTSKEGQIKSTKYEIHQTELVKIASSWKNFQIISHKDKNTYIFLFFW